MPTSKSDPILKVSVFVIDDNDRLLVFDHPSAPIAGIQVPAGTIQHGEQPMTAAFRELSEETGNQSFTITQFVARTLIHEVRHGRKEVHDRWFFQASPTQELPEEWVFGELTPTGWIPFHFHWISRPTAESTLTPDHAEIYKLTAPER